MMRFVPLALLVVSPLPLSPAVTGEAQLALSANDNKVASIDGASTVGGQNCRRHGVRDRPEAVSPEARGGDHRADQRRRAAAERGHHPRRELSPSSPRP